MLSRLISTLMHVINLNETTDKHSKHKVGQEDVENGDQLCGPLLLVFTELSGGHGAILDRPQV